MVKIDIEQHLQKLDGLRQKMGASAADFSADMEDLGEIEELGQLLLEGVDDVQLSDVKANSGGLLEYKGYQVVLYIPDQGFRIEEVMIDGALGKKFHVMDCRTLRNMRAAGRGERYSVRNGLGNTFPVHGVTKYRKKIEGVEAELVVCKNCLNESNYKGYRSHSVRRKDIFSEFDLEEFFTTYSSYFKHPPIGADNKRANEYTTDWKSVSAQFRASKEWICESCGIDLSDPSHKYLLHTHHINGQRRDNNFANLKALCKDCHSKEPYHERLFISHKDRLRINQLRRQQNQFHQHPEPKQQGENIWKQVFREADPAVHGLIEILKKEKKAVPEVGADLLGKNGEVVGEAELVWERKKIAVVLSIEEQVRDELTGLGWTIYTAKEKLDAL